MQYSISGLLYTFSSMSIHAVTPVSGPTKGGTRIVIRLNKPMVLSKLQCSFGPQLVPASFESMSIVLCYSPPLDSAASVTVSLATAAALMDSTASFRYYSEIEVREQNIHSACSPLYSLLLGETSAVSRSIADLWPRVWRDQNHPVNT